jgi:hypothetical protein
LVEVLPGDGLSPLGRRRGARRGKLGSVEERVMMLTSERDSLSYAAHVENDPKARKRIEAIGHELAAVSSEEAALNAALTEAGKRLKAAEATARAAEEGSRARKALQLGKQLRDQALAMDAAARGLFATFEDLRATAIELNRMGAMPSIGMIDAACRRAILSASTGTRLQLEPVPPGERHSFTELADRWSATINGFAEPRLGTAAKKEAA